MKLRDETKEGSEVFLVKFIMVRNYIIITRYKCSLREHFRDCSLAETRPT